MNDVIQDPSAQVPLPVRLQDGLECRRALFDVLMCPKCKQPTLINTDSLLRCSCGVSYRKHRGLLALRPQDEISSVDRKLDEHRDNKYSRSGFVAAFIARQYGPFLQYSEGSSPLPNDWFSHELAASNLKCEGFYQALVSLARPYVSPKSIVLDIGCGAGRLTGELSRTSRLSIGVDFSPEMIEAASQIVLGNGNKAMSLEIPFSHNRSYETTVSGWSRKNCEFVIADCLTLPISARSIDMVTCAYVLHRVSDPPQAIDEILRVLKRDGILIVSNSYDWQPDFTKASNWFEGLTSVLREGDWQLQTELDWVPFTTPIFQRKTTTKYNHLQVLRKLQR